MGVCSSLLPAVSCLFHLIVSLYQLVLLLEHLSLVEVDLFCVSLYQADLEVVVFLESFLSSFSQFLHVEFFRLLQPFGDVRLQPIFVGVLLLQDASFRLLSFSASAACLFFSASSRSASSL